ncbi:transcription termination factor Rho [Candidatus Roizmanbacteria bacterium RIFCSPHIGHO2_12_FULL_44_10]|uniref:Transcription termination factor Rho n=1 Tax=Candidatus Roizmanbacteria bacterium RIFCSPHIGHO2_12_FULL_44_10 TaxID=1802054 RepID=A0A1F7I9V4_9BACT|nr:MAG: transcription termination factor Rho [Candidatus Roizmanbacteria bacterium RIFCSPHIGHO2_12_FULL_44_10]
MSDSDDITLTADDLQLDDQLETPKVETPKKTIKKESPVKKTKTDDSRPTIVMDNTKTENKEDLAPLSVDAGAMDIGYGEGMPPLEHRIKDDLKMAFPGKGILEVTPSGFGFLRPKFIPSNDDIYVSQSQIRKFWLRPGDEVEGLIRPPKDNEKYHGLLKIEKVNDQTLTEEQSRDRLRFNQVTSLYPDKQLVLETDQDIYSTRIMDLLSPIGFGQRGMIVSPPKAGKTTLLKHIAAGITKNFPEVHLIAILIGERPEEVTDLTRSMKAEVVSSHFDQSPRDQIRAAEIGLNRAKRLVESGKDVVILLDSVTRLARAYNMAVNPSGRTLSGGFDPAALYPAKKFLGAARHAEEGGSLTIIGTALVNTESRMDDLIYEEFKGTGNMEVHLDREYANKRIYPAIDIEKSGTRHDELLLDKETMEKVAMIRRMMALLDKNERLMTLINKMAKTKNNAEFLNELKIGK